MIIIRPLHRMCAINKFSLFRLIVSQNRSSTAAKTFTSQSMSKAWTIKKVVPDLLDEVPPIKLGIQYPTVNINEGTIVHPTQVKDQPSVSWAVKGEPAFYALCMVDPDAPSRSKPVQREWQHWMVVNIEGNIVEKGEILTEYIGAGPPKGTDFHRYVFLLYAYPKKINFTEKKVLKTSADGRAKFSIKKFAEKYNFKGPIAGNFFMAEYDDYVPQLLKQLGLK